MCIKVFDTQKQELYVKDIVKLIRRAVPTKKWQFIQDKFRRQIFGGDSYGVSDTFSDAGCDA